MFSMPKEFSKQTLTEFIGHKDEVNCVSYSPDFQFIVTGSDDHRVRIFNVKTKLCVIKLRGHTGAVKCVAVSQCSKYVASGSFDKSARIWVTATGECLHILMGHYKSIESVSFSPGAIYLCTASWDRTAVLWCTQTGLMLQVFPGHGSLVQSVAFSYDSHMLASGSWDFTVRVWKLEHKLYKNIRDKKENLKDGMQIQDRGYTDSHLLDITETVNSDVEEANEEKVQKFKVLIGHSGNVHAVAFSFIGMLASGSWDRTVRLWNPWKGFCLRLLEGHVGWVQAVSFSPDSTYVASAADDDYVKIWDILSGECVNTLEGDTDMAQFCAFTPDGELVASGAAVVQGNHLPKRKNEEDVRETEDKLLAMLSQF